MSRFGLRSNSDGCKISDEKTKRQNLCKSAKVTLKRVHPKKKKPLSPIDDIKSRDTIIGEPSSKVSIICSVPLNRISGFIKKLNLKNSKSNIKTICQTPPRENTTEGNGNGNGYKTDEEIRETGYKHSNAAIITIMCLYCDKKFASHKMQMNHIEKFHTQKKERRCSGRTSQIVVHDPKKSCGGSQLPSTSPVTSFPGCRFCKKIKVQQIVAPAKDLKNLFSHFIECHADKYFGCNACMLRFQNFIKLSKHMESIHELPLHFDDITKSKERETDSSEKAVMRERSKLLKTRLQKSSKNSNNSIISTAPQQCTTTNNHNSIIGAEEPILSRLGLTQNRLPNNRKGVRLRREAILSDMLLKSEPTSTFPTPSKLRNKATKSIVFNNVTDADVVFRMPTRSETISCVFDDTFYKEVIANVRVNLLYYLDGKITDSGKTLLTSEASAMKLSLPTHQSLSYTQSTFIESPTRISGLMDSEIHAATNLIATTAFPTLLTAEQYGGDVGSSKIKRPHTKHSWKWKWDSVKKYKLINEGGKIIKKMKQPMHGIRDLSKLDMWTQLTMRQKYEQHQHKTISLCDRDHNECTSTNDVLREEKQILKDQLNCILDMRVLPHIILEQSEQAVIKVENDDYASNYHDTVGDETESDFEQRSDNEAFLSMLHLLPHKKLNMLRRTLVLSGEWARPRCYLCMCCGAKFEKLKSLEEHKMFRHSHILSMHYEVVGRDLLAGNLLRHLFIPKRALSRYGKDNSISASPSHRLVWGRHDMYGNRIITPEDESSDSIQSVLLNSSTTQTYSIKNSTTDDCDTDTKTTLDINTTSPSHSLQSSSSSNGALAQKHMKKKEFSNGTVPICTKCKRKCNGVLDLYRHMLDCSGDYVWSLAKKRKYRYYCGSKKRRPYNKHNFPELRKNKQKNVKTTMASNSVEDLNANLSKAKSSPRQRPSDAESIKKMLENLPPKRVCKKIFPNVTKAKKSRNQTFIAKRKIYNQKALQTRTRKMSQSAKLLSKTKNQYSIKRTKKKAFNHRIKNVKKIEKRTRLLSSGKKLSATSLGDNDNDLTKPTPRNGACLYQTPKDHKERECDHQIADESCVKTLNSNTPLKTAVINSFPDDSKTSTTVTNTVNVTKDLDSTRNVYDNLRSSTLEQRLNSELNSHLNISLDNNNVKTNSQQTNNSNCSKKRVKRISDCIAMLTGKLEEKLKTEQKAVSSNEIVSTEIDASIVVSKEEKRTLKRKTISRRIIKPDMNDINTSLRPPSPALPHKDIEISNGPIHAIASASASASATIPTPSTPLPPAPNLPARALPAPISLPPVIPAPVPPMPIPPVPVPPPPLHPAPIPSTSALPAPASLTCVPLAITPTPVSPAPAAVPVASCPAAAAIPPSAPSVATTKAIISPAPVNLNLLPKLPLFVPIEKLAGTSSRILPPLPLPVDKAQLGITSSVAILQPPQLLSQPMSPMFNEPLNLSNVKRVQMPNSTQQLISSTALRSNMPARRQTICGFEVRDIIALEDNEPLDLSKKSKNDTHLTASLSQNAMLPTTLNQINDAIPRMPIPCATLADAFLGKQIYSSLDLLKIPQVRNPVNMPTNEVINLNPKPNTKKRSNSKVITELNTKLVTVSNLGKFHGAKEFPMPKKEACSKNKPLQKMDEIVINHIDDAINSVINAVKASLPEDNDDSENLSIGKNSGEKTYIGMDAEIHIKPYTQLMDGRDMTFTNNTPSLPATSIASMPPATPVASTTLCTPTTLRTPAIIGTPTTLETPAIIGAPAALGIPTIIGTPQKRCVRSKTLDCRPTALLINELPNGFQNEIAFKDVQRTEITETIEDKTKPIANKIQIEMCETDKTNKTNSTSESIRVKEVVEVNNGVITAIDNVSISNVNNTVDIIEENTPNEKNLQEIEIIKDNTPCANNSEVLTTKDIDTNVEVPETITTVHSKALTPQNSEPSEAVPESQKKQRRRRKNELAAIVADQLLESFKIDKARRDNLKKLEYLAYEKSEDLLLTGMLLMSSTKRNASSAFSSNQNNSEKDNDKNLDSLKRQKVNQVKNLRTKSKRFESEKPETNSDEEVAEKDASDKTNVLPKEKELDFRKCKRRQYRRRGKTLDNENISKLKSSLESFSIGIEKQLCEIEAKNANIFNVKSDVKSSNTSLSQPSKTVSILRPSILSISREQINATNQSGEGKTVVSSRDPRVNKNIHKDEKGMEIEKKNGTSDDCKFHFVDEKKLENICDLEEDNYLTEIAKNVNEKIMSSENEEFAFANDGFDMANELQDDSNSKYSRPPTSMSVRSAPNFNDDHSNFGSICDENTNTEVMDMDLDDELSVYTSYSQDVGRGRGRKRRRRRSILLKRRPKKRPGRNLSSEKFECELCKKTFFTSNSLVKHTMTLAHVSKVSEQEYLLSKSVICETDNRIESPHVTNLNEITTKNSKNESKSVKQSLCEQNEVKSVQTSPPIVQKEISLNSASPSKTLNNGSNEKGNHNLASRLTLNPDERLFFECCNILKSAETPHINKENHINAVNYVCIADSEKTAVSYVADRGDKSPSNNYPKIQPTSDRLQKSEFRDPQAVLPHHNKTAPMNIPNEHNMLSPFYSAVSQFSAVTNTTSRFKTKAAMKGYENMYVDLTVHQEVENKSRKVCKLTELAEIALENEKPNSTENLNLSNTHREGSSQKHVSTLEFITSSPVGNQKDCSLHLNREYHKNNETQSSTSSKTIMHSSIIKAAVEEHNKIPSGKIVIPDRPFKNIGLEETETITFQKPKTAINLLTDDNSVTTASYSDRDDFDFGSMSCDDDASIKTNNDKNIKNESSESSSTRTTAKTFENKSLIMGRIFKNAGSTKTMSTAKNKNVAVPKEQTARTDLNQIFDELRGECAGKGKNLEESLQKEMDSVNTDNKTADKPATAINKDARVKKKNTGKKGNKDICKLQSELGMSPEDIEKLIVEGRRKSKRRCATNQPKKLVEMWSSDEYEEFLSTKDIIALIEEKEKQEKRRKRKHSANHTDGKDLELNSIDEAESKKRNTRPQNVIERENKTNKDVRNLKTINKKGDTNKKAIANSCDDNREKQENNHSLTQPSPKLNVEKINNKNTSTNNKGKKVNMNVPKTKCDHITIVKSVTATDGDSTRTAKAKNCSKGKEKDEINNKPQSSPEDDSFRLPNVKRNNNYRTRNKEKLCNNHNKDVNNLTINTNNKEIASNESIKTCNSNRKYKGKRRAPTNQSPPRRKRLASEKLYYWSSSSDEDFGRIKTSHVQELENGEQYRKHGWIVGDSHKKLVTLLAIAKGNKRVDNCGVKKNISKKKI